MNRANRRAVRSFVLPLLVTVAIAGACKSPMTPAVNVEVAGEWSAGLYYHVSEQTIVLTLSQVDSTITGTASMTSNIYHVTGTTRGDSVFLRLMPPEDQTIRIAGRALVDTIRGVSWFEEPEPTRSNIILTRR
jgi:hypothetical protein